MKKENNVQVEDWDFTKFSRSDAKDIAKHMINFATVAMLAGVIIVTLLLGGINFLILRNIQSLSETHEKCLSTIRPSYDDQNQVHI